MKALPAWVWVGAVTLSAVAGMVNVIGYLGFAHQVVSHLTGTTSLLGVALAQGDWPGVGFLWGVLIAFSLGAMCSGLIIQDSTLRLGRRYGVALLLESALLLAAVPLFERHGMGGAWLAAMACGVQNALATTYSGALIRTTHLSGMFTDLGIGLGHLLRGLPLPMRRLTLSGLIISGFLGGSLVGAWLFAAWHYRALYVPAAITGIAGGGYVAWRQWTLARARRAA
ncbi:YoaK family protein [Stenotrophomonas sp. HITSZ_GD]|uniref:YoaK family protein n=1 Tax=Stenotrophomonas sp. HITSZ_GD TaxID=3037248 RepID=UPI00240D0434|nr:YoaK family protein [Stenotrophomonas sp. HITSZ_GD]MDG2526899.1 YoaK family protein [Stenotrophomonas sp. HITSZ_GD]